MRYASLVLLLIAAITQSQACRSGDCTVMCGSTFNPVCGSDGQTYKNRCLLSFRNCQRSSSEEEVHEVYAGECEGEEYDWETEADLKYKCLRIGRGKYLMC